MADRRCVHPDHDVLCRELRGWFTNSVPDVGYFVSKHWYGYLTEPDSAFGARLILDIEEGRQVPEALEEAQGTLSNEEITIWVDDRERVRRLDGPLRELGYRRAKATTHLALVDRLAAEQGPEDLEINEIDAADLERWATVKLQSFDNVETNPSPERLSAEIAVRRGELALADYQLGMSKESRLPCSPITVAAIGLFSSSALACRIAIAASPRRCSPPGFMPVAPQIADR